MSYDFKNLIEDIEAEAKAEGSEAELRELRREFSIASQLMTLRREKKLTQKQLAQASGIPQSEISRIETGEANPTYATLAALAEPTLVARWNTLVLLRERVLAEIEPLRKNKQIGSSLQAKVVITAAAAELPLLERYAKQLPMLFIVPDVALRPSADRSSATAVDAAASVSPNVCVATR